METVEHLARIEEKLDKIFIAQKEVWTLDDLVLITGKPKPTLYEKVRKRELPSYKQGKDLYFRKEDVHEWLLKNRRDSIEELQHRAERMSNERRKGH